MSSIKQYMKFVKPYTWQIIWTVIIGVVRFAIPLLTHLILKYVIDHIIEAEQLANAAKLDKLFLIMGVALAIYIIIRPPIEYLRQYLA